MKGSDQEILAGSPVETTFAGKTYIWTQSGRREQREIRSALANVVALVMGAEAMGENAGVIPTSINAINALINFCEDYHDGMAADMDDIESHLLHSGSESWLELIEGVYNPLYKAWLEPYFVGSKGARKKPVSKKKKPVRRNSTKS